MGYNIVEFINSNRDTLDLIMDLVPIPLFVKDIQGRYIDCNNAFTDFLSFSREEIIGKSVYELWRKEEADVFYAQDNELFETGGLQIYESNITSSDGQKHIVQFHKQIFKDSNGNTAGFLGAVFDITEKKELEDVLARQATHDELTGLPNRRYGMSRLIVLHKLSIRKKRPYCMAMIDIDHFKCINDQYGHYNGDIVLKEFSAMVQKNLRTGDLCFRYGGEEFVVLLPETALEDGYAVMERLRIQWAENSITLSEGQSISSRISIGVILYDGFADEKGTTCEQLLKDCDNVLYDAKNNGRNRTVAKKNNQLQGAVDRSIQILNAAACWA